MKYRLIQQSISFQWITIILALVLTSFSVYSNIRIPEIIGDAIDAVFLNSSNALALILPYLIQLICYSIIENICLYCSSTLVSRIITNVRYNMRSRLFLHNQMLPFSYLDCQSTGSMMELILTDVDIVCDGIQLITTQLFSSVLSTGLTVYFMLRLNARAALIVIVLTPISILFTRFIAKQTKKYSVNQSASREKEAGFLNELLHAQNTMLLYNMNDPNHSRLTDLDKEYVNNTEKAFFFSSLTNPTTRLINSLIYAFLAFIGGRIAIGESSFSIGSYSTLLSFANKFGKPFNDISSVLSEIQSAIVSAQRIESYYSTTETEQNPFEEYVVETFESKGSFDFHQVDFSYSPNKPLIQNLNLSVPDGTKVAIVGPTGCGKTTFINLLMRFYDPVSGQIRFNQIPYQDYVKRQLRSNFGMVLQETWIKNATVFENIALGSLNATKEDVINAAKITKADEFISKLPNQYDTIIGPEGTTLSEGQKQLLCITRLFVDQHAVLILDEATSSIDTRTERQVFDAIDRLIKGKTSFIVAHRLSTIVSADLILVMKDGNIIEKGSHEQLMNQRGFYLQLFNSQYEHVGE